MEVFQDKPQYDNRKSSADFEYKPPHVSNWADSGREEKHFDSKMQIHSQTQINVKNHGLGIPVTISSPVVNKTPTKISTPTMPRGLSIFQFNEFLHLLLLNHQRTVIKLSKKPDAKNASKSFDPFLRHLKLAKQISEYIWDKPEPYTAQMIIDSKIRNGLWKFVSYCEAYYDDCDLVKRAHVNLYLIIQIFTNIVNNSVK